MMRTRLSRLVPGTLGLALAATPGWAAPTGGVERPGAEGSGASPTRSPPLARAPGQSWLDLARSEAVTADGLEKRGLFDEARATRERVLVALARAWREDREPEALEPLLITLHRRLGRSTTAVEVTLRLMYELHAAPDVDLEHSVRLAELNAQLGHAMARLRREAREGDPATCRGAPDHRAGELALDGVLPDEPLLLLRDRPDGGVEAVRCAAAPEPSPAPPPAMPAPSHWWFTGAGIGLMAAGGVLTGFGVQAQRTYDRLADPQTQAEARDHLRADGARVGLFAGGGTLLATGAVALLVGLHLAGSEPGPHREPAIGVGPSGVELTLRFH